LPEASAVRPSRLTAATDRALLLAIPSASSPVERRHVLFAAGIPINAGSVPA